MAAAVRALISVIWTWCCRACVKASNHVRFDFVVRRSTASRDPKVKIANDLERHPSIHFHPLIRGRVGKATGKATSLSPATLSSSSQRIPERSQARRDIITPASPGSALGPPSITTCPENLQRETTSRQQKPDAWTFRCEGAAPLLRVPHPISKVEPSHPPKETHFSCLYSWSRSFGHYPDLMTIGEGWNKDGPVKFTTRDWSSVLNTADNAPLRLSISRSNPDTSTPLPEAGTHPHLEGQRR